MYENLNGFNPSHTINQHIFFCYRVILLSCSIQIAFLEHKKNALFGALFFIYELFVDWFEDQKFSRRILILTLLWHVNT